MNCRFALITAALIMIACGGTTNTEDAPPPKAEATKPADVSLSAEVQYDKASLVAEITNQDDFFWRDCEFRIEDIGGGVFHYTARLSVPPANAKGELYKKSQTVRFVRVMWKDASGNYKRGDIEPKSLSFTCQTEKGIGESRGFEF